MPVPQNLIQLGHLLKQRREELGLRRSEIARQVGVSQTYIGLIEEAKPRAAGRGNPSRPKQDVLLAWMRALGLGRESTKEVLTLAGYLLPDSHERHSVSGKVLRAEDRKGMVNEASEDYALLPWQLQTQVLLNQMREVLRLAEDRDQHQEVAQLLGAVLDLLKFRLQREE